MSHYQISNFPPPPILLLPLSPIIPSLLFTIYPFTIFAPHPSRFLAPSIIPSLLSPLYIFSTPLPYPLTTSPINPLPTFCSYLPYLPFPLSSALPYPLPSNSTFLHSKISTLQSLHYIVRSDQQPSSLPSAFVTVPPFFISIYNPISITIFPLNLLPTFCAYLLLLSSPPLPLSPLVSLKIQTSSANSPISTSQTTFPLIFHHQFNTTFSALSSASLLISHPFTTISTSLLSPIHLPQHTLFPLPLYYTRPYIHLFLPTLLVSLFLNYNSIIIITSFSPLLSFQPSNPSKTSPLCHLVFFFLNLSKIAPTSSLPL